MKYLFCLLVFCSLVLSSCLKENLDPSALDKVLLLQVDYKTYTFEGGKEFSYFEEDNSTVDLPITKLYNNSLPGQDGRLTIKYTTDTIFDGTLKWDVSGERLFPITIDNQIHYMRLENKMAKPDTSRFQIIHYDLSGVPIDYDSVWLAIAKIQKVSSYLLQNKNSKIGLFLYRPREGASIAENPGDWKWYLIFKD